MISIEEYFLRQYEDAITEGDWQEVLDLEKQIFLWYKLGDERFYRFIEKSSIDLYAQKGRYPESLLWTWQMESLFEMVEEFNEFEKMFED